MAGRVEGAVRAAIMPGDVLATPSGRGQFTIARYTTNSLVLLLGEKEAWTPLPWRALEEIPDLLRGRGWVLIGSLYSTGSHRGSLDEHLKKYLKRATAGWVAVVLEKAAVISIDRSVEASKDQTMSRLVSTGNQLIGRAPCTHECQWFQDPYPIALTGDHCWG